MAGNAIELAFASIHEELGLALVACDLIGVPALAGHLTGLATQLDTEGMLLTNRYRELGEQAAAAIFGHQGLAERGMLSGTTP